VSPFPLQEAETLAEHVRRGAAGLLHPVAGLGLVLAGGAFMAVLAVPAFATAVLAARAHPELKAALAAATAADDASG
jgi:hypothetical protein